MATYGSSASRLQLVGALARAHTKKRVVVETDARKLRRAARRGKIAIDARGVAELVLQSGVLNDEAVPAAPAARRRGDGQRAAA